MVKKQNIRNVLRLLLCLLLSVTVFLSCMCSCRKKTSHVPASVQKEPSEPVSPKTEPTVRVIDPNKKMVAITFDDGPHAIYTDNILDILETNGVVATFFEVGENLNKAPEALKRAMELGCELGSHSYSHINLKKASAKEIDDEIEKANAAFKELTGVVPTLLRPPYGEIGELLRNKSNQFLIGWSVDTMDWKYRDAAKVIDNVKSESDLDGDVILMHSIYPSTVDAVRELVPWLIQNGYQLVTVSELMQYRVDNPFQKGVYYGYDAFK